MPLPVPRLDDRTFDQLASEARALIPRHFPAWTDHNPSDPGITLLELFAFVVEAAIYQLDRVPDRSLARFAALVGVTPAAVEQPDALLRRALAELRRRDRAVTREELERLAREAAPGRVARARALVETTDTPNVYPDETVVRVVVVPVPASATDLEPTPDPTLRETVFAYLEARRLVTTRVRVVAPDYTPVRIDVEVIASPAAAATVGQVETAIRGFLHPLIGGLAGAGWEFGRSLYRSELYQLVEGLPGVDHVRSLRLEGSETLGEVQMASIASLVRIASLAVTLASE